MAKNKRKVYGAEGTGRGSDVRPCAVCGCRHFDVCQRDAKTGKVRKRICRNCGAVVPAT